MAMTTTSLGAAAGPRMPNSRRRPKFCSSSSPAGIAANTSPALAIKAPSIAALDARPGDSRFNSRERDIESMISQVPVPKDAIACDARDGQAKSARPRRLAHRKFA